MVYEFLDATPCPVTWDRDKDSKIPIFEDILDSFDDDTAAIDFTSELGSLNALTRDKPRRATKAAAFRIHEDIRDLANGQGRRSAVSRESSLFSQPAQRLPRPARAAFGGKQSPKIPEKKRLSQSVKKIPGAPAPKDLSRASEEPSVEQKTDRATRLKRSKRRNTIYIPPDDTTMATIFMGAFSPMETRDFNCREAEYIEVEIARRRKQHKPPPPRSEREPLESPKRIIQESSIKSDIMGRNTGKENVPPGQLVESNMGIIDMKKDLKSAGTPTQPMNTVSVNSPRFKMSPLKQKLACSPKPQKPRLSYSKNIANRAESTLTGRSETKWHVEMQLKGTIRSRPQTPMKEEAPSHCVDTDPLQHTRDKLPFKALSQRPSAKVDMEYPLLTGNITDPAMYEENWLTHQEVVITQLVNTLFESTDKSKNSQELDQDCLRHQLLGLYQDTYLSLLYKRVQASLLYGDLRVTNEFGARGSRLKNDVGVRRKFLKFWLDTYDISALRVAAEVVLGRRISHSAPPTEGTDGHAEPKGLRRAVELFLDAVLIRNEDMDPSVSIKPVESTPANRLFRRTALRSIMMVVLLDKARMAPDTALPCRLFKLNSPYKSSAAVLRALGSLLQHPQGDFTRPLARLDCSVGYQQSPLSEYNFRINNIAVDIRDGVILARLTEMLLDERNRETNNEKETQSLMEKLKMPCISRATKIHNVHVSLSALAKYLPGIGAMISDIKADSIVDGYREKTVALLWAIVGKWGISVLVDWDDLGKEIGRLERKIARIGGKVGGCIPWQKQDDTQDITGYYTTILHRWASCLARLKGLEVLNLTTSLADGRVFASIIDEYEYFIRPACAKVDMVKSSSATATTTTTTAAVAGGESALAQRLLLLGCSSQFVSLLCPRSASPSATRPPTPRIHVIHEDSNIAALAFLSSRLLSASRYGRAAVSIQRAWRHRLCHQVTHGRAVREVAELQALSPTT